MVLIGLLITVLLSRAKDVFLVFAPLFLAALLTMAGSVLLSLPFNFANVIVLPLLFGLGVASSIHFVLRQRATSNLSALLTRGAALTGGRLGTLLGAGGSPMSSLAAGGGLSGALAGGLSRLGPAGMAG